MSQRLGVLDKGLTPLSDVMYLADPFKLSHLAETGMSGTYILSAADSYTQLYKVCQAGQEQD